MQAISNNYGANMAFYGKGNAPEVKKMIDHMCTMPETELKQNIYNTLVNGPQDVAEILLEAMEKAIMKLPKGEAEKILDNLKKLDTMA